MTGIALFFAIKPVWDLWPVAAVVSLAIASYFLVQWLWSFIFGDDLDD